MTKQPITSLSDLVGKQIKAAELVDEDESIELVFEDDTYAVIDVYFYVESHDLKLMDKVSDYIQHQIGVISVEECSALVKKEREMQTTRTDEHERRLYDRLKLKYGGDPDD